MQAQSDDILYNDISWLHWKAKQQNDEQFLYQMGKSTNACHQNRPLETELIQGIIHARSCPTQNPRTPYAPITCPKPVTPASLNWFIEPSLETTHRNYLTDRDCTIVCTHHQMFKNCTRRR